MASTKLKAEHLSIYSFQIIQTKHLTFHKGEYVGHLEPAITDDTTIHQTEVHQTNSITLQKMMAEQVKPDVFDPPSHKLTTNIQNELDALLKEYKLQFAKDRTSIGIHLSPA